jgi:hypothetical protein
MAERDAPVMTSDVPLDPWSHLRVWLFCGGVLLVLRGLSRDPVWVERGYVEGWGTTVASGLAWWTSGVGFSVGEVVVGLLVVAEILSLLTAFAEVGAGRRRASNAVLAGLAHLVDLALFLGMIFYLVWGISYARPPALQRLGWEGLVVEGEVTPEITRELHVLTELAQSQAHEAYRALHGSDDAGVVTTPRDGLDLNAAVDRGYARAGAALGLSSAFSDPRGPYKVPFGSELMSWAGIGGVYIPFTGEATVNGGPPRWSLVMTVAHEKAHQRMVASEDEASFYGFLACVHSEEPVLRYAAWQFAWRQLRRALASVDPVAVAALDARELPGLLRDRQAVADYWTPYEGWLEQLHGWMNDAYLKANRVEGGVLAYGRAGRLVAAYLQSAQGRSRHAEERARAVGAVEADLRAREAREQDPAREAP